MEKGFTSSWQNPSEGTEAGGFNPIKASADLHNPSNSEPEEYWSELNVLRRFYDSLKNFGQENTTPVQRYDYIKARIHDCRIGLEKSNQKKFPDFFD